MTAVTLDLAAPPPAARELDLGAGVVVVVKPWTGLLAAAAETMMAGEAETLKAGIAGPLWGFDLADGDLDTPELFSGWYFLAHAATRLALRAERWNLIRPDGEPMPLTRYMVARLFHRGTDGAGGAEHLTAFLKAEA